MRLRFTGVCRVSDAQQQVNRENSHRLGLPEIGTRSVAPNLAVVGGSPALADHLHALRAWDGEIWAINGTVRPLLEAGIDAALFRVDPQRPTSWHDGMFGGVRRAVLADICDASMFVWCREHGVDVEVAKIGGVGGLSAGTTAACTAPTVAAARGHGSVTFFGCDSSYTDVTHHYRDEMAQKTLLWVECGGAEYVTSPQMLMQAEWLSEMARALPGFIEVRGGGLLGAMIEHGDHDVTAATQNIHDQIKEQAV